VRDIARAPGDSGRTDEDDEDDEDTMSESPTGSQPDENTPGEGPREPDEPDQGPHPSPRAFVPPDGFPTAPPAYATGGTQFSIGDAIGFGFRRFGANWTSWVLVALVLVAVQAVWGLIDGSVSDVRNAFDDSSGSASFHVGFGGTLLSVVAVVIGFFITSFLANGGLLEAAGHRPAFGEFFRVRNMGNVVLAAIVVGVLTGIGFVLCLVPGLAVALFSVFVFYVALDQDLGGLDAIRASWRLVARNFGSVLGLLVLLVLINLVGFFVCVVGLLVTIPVSYITVGYAYRALSGATAA
jgi:uncharacterized membrane protein